LDRTRQETILSAPTIVCGGCAGAIKNALGKLGGVEAVEVDVATKRVSVAHDSCVTRERLVEALDDAGFPAE
jgi:copper chaperone CopZ